VHGRPDIVPARSVCIDVKSKTNNANKNPKKSPRADDDTMDNKKQKVDLSLNFSGLPLGRPVGIDPTAIKQRMQEAIMHTMKGFEDRVINNMIQR
jgi:hypothetical protein